MKKYLKIMYRYSFGFLGFGLLLLAACSSAPVVDEEIPSPTTPVEVTNVVDSSMGEYVVLSAVSAYLEKSFVKANMNGYVESSNIKIGKNVGRGQVIFSLITKEARSIGSSINQLDPSFKFSGISNIRADAAGFVIQINHQKGDYVQDGEAMATIINKNSLVFLLDVPYELNQLVTSNNSIIVNLTDGKKLIGKISGTMPAVDSLAQTQRFIIKVAAVKDLPEGLIGSVSLAKTFHPITQILPKSAILASETEDEFWVMKLINDSTAVKVKIEKGIENATSTEVLKPKFGKTDKIIITGNYGLADTAKVKILK